MPAGATAQGGQSHVYVNYVSNANRGTWLFQGAGSYQGANSHFLWG